MRRPVVFLVGLSLVATSFVACRDAALAPSSAAEQPLQVAGVPRLSGDLVASNAAGFSFTVTIDPTRTNVYSDGISTIRIPAGAICDLETSGYGPATWDLPCAPETDPITMSVTVSALRSGSMLLHFGRDLRFAPTSDPARQVHVTVDAPGVRSTSESLRRYAIFWVPSGTTRIVDEGADPSMVTFVDRTGGKLSRRLKHFSGYVIRQGIVDGTCENPEASTEDECVPVGEVVTNGNQ